MSYLLQKVQFKVLEILLKFQRNDSQHHIIYILGRCFLMKTTDENQQ